MSAVELRHFADFLAISEDEAEMVSGPVRVAHGCLTFASRASLANKDNGSSNVYYRTKNGLMDYGVILVSIIAVLFVSGFTRLYADGLMLQFNL